MGMIKVQGMTWSTLFRFAVSAAAILFLIKALPAIAEEKIVTQETLLDRIQIEDMLIRYYVDISSGYGQGLAQSYTEDAVFDVNGMIAKGREAISKMYGGLDEENAHVGSDHQCGWRYRNGMGDLERCPERGYKQASRDSRPGPRIQRACKARWPMVLQKAVYYFGQQSPLRMERHL